MRDDKMLGLRSTALKFQDNGKIWISGFYAATAARWLFAGVSLGLSWVYFLVLGMIAAHFGWQMWAFDVRRPDRHCMLFRSNMVVGVLLLLAALGGTLIG